ncbi:MAG: threonylcarbamoyl-AMP synthase [Lachnospiraceae bacterium]|nr:threonylcarbamoyl-AMP synthase [Lachnospiraceae bacterium]
MDTEILRIESAGEHLTPDADELLQRAGAIIRQGGLVAFPTETVYGLGGDALNASSSEKIYAAKGRPSDNPLIIHICRIEDLRGIVKDVPEVAYKIAKAFWPGPLTMIMEKADIVPTQTTGGLNTVAVRFPSHKIAQKLIEYSGGFVAAPSANLSGKPSPTGAKYVIEDMRGRIDAIIDGGDVGIGLESTILDLTVTPPQILRPGYVTQQMLEELLGEVEIDRTTLREDTKEAPKAPGMKYRHYAPKADLLIVEGSLEAVVAYINRRSKTDRQQGKKVGIIATGETCDSYEADVIKDVGFRGDQETIARNLFRVLREFDDAGVDCIYSEGFDTDGLGQAIMNRLLKAAGHKRIQV